MKISDIYRNIATMMDMCEGTNVLPHQCVKINGGVCQEPNAYGITRPGRLDNWEYEFALAIVEDKPVFAGDVLWSTWLNKEVKITGIHEAEDSELFFLAHYSDEYPTGNSRISKLTWTKPYPFAELLQAQAEGKRVVFYDGAKWIDTDGIDCVNFKPESYKVVEHDAHETITIWVSIAKTHVKTKYTKCGITGKISAEVIE